MNLHRAAAILLSASLSIYAMASQAETSGLYVGLTVGQSNVDLSEDEFNAALLAALSDQNVGAAITGSSLDDTDTSFGLYLGYGFNPYVAFEIGYIDLGDVGQKTNLNTSLGAVTASNRFSSSGGTVAIVGSYPFAERFNAYGRGGLYLSDTRVKVKFRDDTGDVLSSASDRASDTDVFVGVGAGWNINDSYTLRVDYQRFLDVGKDAEQDVNLFSVSIVFR